MCIEEVSRGTITEELSKKYSEFWEHDMTVTELRLVPYLYYCIVDHRCIDPRKITSDERKIISNLRKRGLIDGGASESLACTRECWDVFTNILWDAYADKIID